MESLFALLDEFGLTSLDTLETRLASWGTTEFHRFFQTYDAKARQRPQLASAELGTTNVYPDSNAGRIPAGLIRQLCVYVNRFYIHDPILDLAHEFRGLDADFAKLIAASETDTPVQMFRRNVHAKIAELVNLRPLAEAGVVHITPSQYVRQRRERDGIYADEFYGPEGQYGEQDAKPSERELSQALSSYLGEHIRVLPVDFRQGRAVVLQNTPLTPRRAIVIHFDDDRAPCFRLLQTVIRDPECQAKDGVIRTQMVFPLEQIEGGVDAATFEHWVKSESRKYLERRMSELEADLYLASLAKAHFLTPLRSSCDLATLNLGNNSKADPVVTSLLQLDLPYLSDVSLSELAKARTDEAAFQDFRVALTKAVAEIEAAEDDKRQRCIEQVMQDVIHAPLARMDKRLRMLSSSTFVKAAIAVGTFVTTIISNANPFTQTLLSVAAMAAALKAAESYSAETKDKDKVREHPSFFYWRATKAARKRRRK